MIFPTYENKIKRKRGKKKFAVPATVVAFRRFGQNGTYDRVTEQPNLKKG